MKRLLLFALLLLGAPAARAQSALVQLDPQISQALIDLSFDFQRSRWRKVRQKLVRSEIPALLYWFDVVGLAAAQREEEVRRAVGWVDPSLPWPLYRGRVTPDTYLISRNFDRLIGELAQVAAHQ